MSSNSLFVFIFYVVFVSSLCRFIYIHIFNVFFFNIFSNALLVTDCVYVFCINFWRICGKGAIDAVRRQIKRSGARADPKKTAMVDNGSAPADAPEPDAQMTCGSLLRKIVSQLTCC